MDTNFIFTCPTRYLTREISRFTLEDEIRIHARACNILYRIYGQPRYMVFYTCVVQYSNSNHQVSNRERTGSCIGKQTLLGFNCCGNCGMKCWPGHSRGWQKVVNLFFLSLSNRCLQADLVQNVVCIHDFPGFPGPIRSLVTGFVRDKKGSVIDSFVNCFGCEVKGSDEVEWRGLEASGWATNRIPRFK